MSCLQPLRPAVEPALKQGDVVRFLGPVERFLAACESTGFYHGCAVSCRYHIPQVLATSLVSAKGSVRDHVERAIARTILDHPSLQVGLRDHRTKKPCWIRLDQIDLQQHVEWHCILKEEDQRAVFEDLCSSYFQSSFPNLERMPAWRITILFAEEDGSWVDVLFAYDHTVCDGMSGRIFQETLHTHLNRAGMDGKSEGTADVLRLKDHILKLPPTACFPPSQDKLIKMPITLSCFLKALFLDDLRLALIPTPTSPTTADWIPFQQPLLRSRLTSFVLDPGATTRVLDECRWHKTTLTGLLQALFLYSFAMRIPKTKALGFSGETPIDLRRFVDPHDASAEKETSPWSEPGKLMGNFVTSTYHHFDTNVVKSMRRLSTKIENNHTKADKQALEGLLWQISGDVRAELKATLDKGLKNSRVSLLKFVGDWPGFLMQMLKKPRTATWDLSNLGSMSETPVMGAGSETENENEWTMQRGVFTQSAAVMGAAVQIGVLGVKDKGISLTASWQEGVISDDVCQGVMDEVERRLKCLGQYGKFWVGREC